MSLILGGVAVPLPAALDLTQSYEPIGAVTTLRTLNGTAIRREHWRKWRTAISGSGWVPAALVVLDYSAALSLSCIAPLVVQSAAPAAALPAARRADAGYVPYCLAVMADGGLADTPIVLAGDAASCTAVAGAVLYLFHYFPILTVFADAPSFGFDAATGAARWDLTAEEV